MTLLNYVGDIRLRYILVAWGGCVAHLNCVLRESVKYYFPEVQERLKMSMIESSGAQVVL